LASDALNLQWSWCPGADAGPESIAATSMDFFKPQAERSLPDFCFFAEKESPDEPLFISYLPAVYGRRKTTAVSGRDLVPMVGSSGGRAKE